MAKIYIDTHARVFRERENVASIHVFIFLRRIERERERSFA